MERRGVSSSLRTVPARVTSIRGSSEMVSRRWPATYWSSSSVTRRRARRPALGLSTASTSTATTHVVDVAGTVARNWRSRSRAAPQPSFSG
ncbi:MAG TPA: hypothetical protein VNO31_21885 [Umezawaea sp.]|nr:hypothetical protein [Umezawaea sp.]